MKTEVNFHEAQKHFSHLLKRVQCGEQIIIAKAGNPVAVLSPIGDAIAQRTPGNDRGKVTMSADFDTPLSEFDKL